MGASDDASCSCQRWQQRQGLSSLASSTPIRRSARLRALQASATSGGLTESTGRQRRSGSSLARLTGYPASKRLCQHMEPRQTAKPHQAAALQVLAEPEAVVGPQGNHEAAVSSLPAIPASSHAPTSHMQSKDSKINEPDGPKSNQNLPTSPSHHVTTPADNVYIYDDSSVTAIDHSIAHWAATGVWPPAFATITADMSEQTPAGKKQKTTTTRSTHQSDRMRQLNQNGIFMTTTSQLQQASEILCDELLDGEERPMHHPPFPAEKFLMVLDRVKTLNEGRIQRDITPWVVPSAETLFFCDQLKVDYLADEVFGDWTRCATLGGTRPKPDYVAGLLPSAFPPALFKRLETYASPARPVLFTPNICFPFLVCEVKSGERGISEADRQNIHSTSIAVRAIMELYAAAYGNTDPERVNALHGQVLVFSISHDNDRVCIYGHYAVPAPASDQGTYYAYGEAQVTKDDDTGDGGPDGVAGPLRIPRKLNFYRYQFANLSLSMRRGMERAKAYTFVRNLYDHFAPRHRQMLVDAAAALPDAGPVADSDLAVSQAETSEPSAVSSSQGGPHASHKGAMQAPGAETTTRLLQRKIERMESERQLERQQMREQLEAQQQQIATLLQQRSGSRET